MQPITNELFLRHPNGSVPVDFEPGVVKFDYGSPTISYSLGRGGTGFSGSKTATGGGGIDSSSLISENASKKVKNALAQQDKDIDMMSEGLNNLIGIANTMNQELVSSEGQIDEARRKMENVDMKLQKQNHQLKNF
jgi:hypothetical protein